MNASQIFKIWQEKNHPDALPFRGQNLFFSFPAICLQAYDNHENEEQFMSLNLNEKEP